MIASIMSLIMTMIRDKCSARPTHISDYRAALGHKLNHSFTKSKAKWGRAFHPRFGHVKCVVAKQDIKQGEEILINYGYRIGTPVPKWTSDLYLEETGKEWRK